MSRSDPSQRTGRELTPVKHTSAPIPKGGGIDGRPLLRQMFDLPSFTEVCTSFVDLYRVGIKVFDEDGTKLVDIKIGSSDFCAYMFTQPPGRQLCTQTVTYLKQHSLPTVPPEAGIAPVESRNCFTGLRYLIAPILHDGDPLGRVVFGPFVPDELPDLGEELAALKNDFELPKARTLMGQIRKTGEPNMRRILEHFMKVLDVLVFAAYRAHLTSEMHIESISASYRELQEKAQELEESNEHLRQLDWLKSNFLATMSHELRTPLTSVIGYSEMLLAGLAGEVQPEQREYLSTILEKGETLMGLISDILDLSKIEARGVTLKVAPADVSEIMKSAVSTLVPSARRKNITLTWDAPKFKPKPIIDTERVRQCVVNLLANAVKFTPDGGTVRAVAKQAPGEDGEGDWLDISVEDTGIGIAPDQHERIFENFYQVDGTATRQYGGTGLGLAIVRSFVDAHGGYIAVDSDVGRGATITMMFPMSGPPPELAADGSAS